MAHFQDAWNRALRDRDVSHVVGQLADPVGSWFRELYEAARRFEATGKKYNAVRNRLAGGFKMDIPDPFSPEKLATGAGVKVKAVRPQSVERMTVVRQQPVGRSGERVVLTVEVVLSNGAGRRTTRTEQLVAVQQRGEWKVLTPAMARLTAEDVEYLQAYYGRRVEMLNALRQKVEESAVQLAEGVPKLAVEVNLFREVGRWREVMLPPAETPAGVFIRAALDLQPMILASQVRGLYMAQRDARTLSGLMGPGYYYEDVPPREETIP